MIVKPTAGITQGITKVLNPIKKVAEFCSKRKLAKTIFDKQVQKEKKKNSGTVMKNYESKIKSLGEFEKVSRNPLHKGIH